VDIFHALGQLVAHSWETAASCTTTHLVLQLLQFFHRRHTAATRHARHTATRHTRHARHSTAAARALRLFTLAVFTLTALWLLLRCRASTAAHAELASHLGHHLLGFVEALDELVNVCDLNTRT